MAAFEPEVSVLAISALREDHLALRDAFRHRRWRIWFARNWREGRILLAEHRIPVILCEDKLPDATWKDVLGEVASLPKAPILIVLSPLADDLLWAEVLNLGGYDMLIKPFDSGEVFHVVGLAWLKWRSGLDHPHMPGAR